MTTPSSTASPNTAMKPTHIAVFMSTPATAMAINSPANATGTPGYATFNVRYGRMISDRQRISVTVENIFDKQYRVHGSGSGGAGINGIVSYELLH